MDLLEISKLSSVLHLKTTLQNILDKSHTTYNASNTKQEPNDQLDVYVWLPVVQTKLQHREDGQVPAKF